MKFCEKILLCILGVGLFVSGPYGFSASNIDKTTLLTILLKHDQTKNLEEIQKNLTQNKFYEKFPPAGTTIVDWHVVMGIGQILVLETPISKLQEVRDALAKTTAGAYATEIFETQNKYPRVAGLLMNKTKKSLDNDPVKSSSTLMTIILKPNQKVDIAKVVSDQKLYQSFPPSESAVVNWYEATGLGDIVTLEFPASLLRTVNLSLERAGWKAYSTDFYSTYDFYGAARDTFKLKNIAKKSL